MLLHTNIQQLNQVIPGLFVGNSETAKDLELLKRYEIKAIVIAAFEQTIYYPNDFDYLHMEILDFESEFILRYFRRMFEFVDNHLKQSNNVFVHCTAGISRSSACVIAYIMYLHRINHELAFKMVQIVRPISIPNRGFRKQLQLFERENFDIDRAMDEYLKSNRSSLNSQDFFDFNDDF